MGDRSLAEIQDKIKDIIVSVSDSEISKDTIDAGENGIRNLGFNSLNMIKMLVEIEKEFDIEIDFDETDAELLSSIGSLSTYILNFSS